MANYLEPGLRYLSTVHFMDSGYWLWVIPLGSKNTSIGIVADPVIHPFDTFNTYEKAVEWMRVNEPLAYKMLVPLGEGDGLMDGTFSYHTGYNESYREVELVHDFSFDRKDVYSQIISIDVNKLFYVTGNIVDVVNEPNYHGSLTEIELSIRVSDNFAAAFSIH